MIGIFDSGIGGLSVVKQIFTALPEFEVAYFGDVARTPYGNRSIATIEQYSCEIYDFLRSEGSEVIVIACHTASAAAASALRSRGDVPVFDVVSAGAQAACQASVNKNIGVMATAGTVKSKRYIDHLKTFDPSVNVYQYACPSLATLVEDTSLPEEIIESAVRHYLADIASHGIDTIILGCTHYPLIVDIIRRVVGDEIALVDPAVEVATQLATYCTAFDVVGSLPTKGNAHRFYVSDQPDRFEDLVLRFLGKSVECELKKL